MCELARKRAGVTQQNANPTEKITNLEKSPRISVGELTSNQNQHTTNPVSVLASPLYLNAALPIQLRSRFLISHNSSGKLLPNA